MSETLTSRGFPEPQHPLDRMEQREERVVVLRITRHEMRMLRVGHGVEGKFVLMKDDDGAHVLVRVSE